MDIHAREDVLLDLAEKFLNQEELQATRYYLRKGDVFAVECSILVIIDRLFENKEISGYDARQAYLALGMDPMVSTEVRQKYEFYGLYYYNQPNPLWN